MSMSGVDEKMQKMEPTMNARVDAYRDLEEFLGAPLAPWERRALELMDKNR